MVVEDLLVDHPRRSGLYTTAEGGLGGRTDTGTRDELPPVVPVPTPKRLGFEVLGGAPRYGHGPIPDFTLLGWSMGVTTGGFPCVFG